MCLENMALPSWYNVFSDEEQIKILSERALFYIQNIGKKKMFKSLHDYFAEVGGPTLLKEQENICNKFYNLKTSSMDYLAKSIIPLCSDRQAVFEGEAANKLKQIMDSFDATLAAPKSYVTNSLFNLYPKYGYKTMLKTIEENILKIM